MKFVTVLACLILGISAAILPGSDLQSAATRDERFISDSIITVIEDVSQDIKDAGLDPAYIESETFGYALPVPVIFNAAAYLEQFFSTGLSEIIVNRMNYAILQSRLTFEIELPHIHISAGRARGEATLFGNTLEVEGDGRVDIRRIVVVGDVRVNVGIISGISISNIDIDLSVGSVNTNIRLAIQGNNYSEEINQLISKTIPSVLEEFRSEINELIEIILIDVINDML